LGKLNIIFWEQNMTPRERIQRALAHKEADHIPLDLAGASNTGICSNVYRNLRRHLNLPERPEKLSNVMQQLALVDDDLLSLLGVDTRPLPPNASASWELKIVEEGDYRSYIDEWQIKWRMPIKGGFYFDMVQNPLSHAQTIQDIDKYRWPDPTDPARYEGLLEKAKTLYQKSQSAIMLGEICGGVFDMTCLVLGYEHCMMSMAYNIKLVEAVMDKVTEFKCRWYQAVLPVVGDHIDIVLECDDICGQQGPLFSHKIYRDIVKPSQKKVFDTIGKYTKAARYFHSCGNVYDYIPDFIEIGVQILNPIQVSARNMDTKVLKKKFGRDLVFWGGGCDTQEVLSRGTVQQVRDEVKRRINDLGPGGGYVFAQVHNIQNDVPAENLVAMWQAWQDFGKY
jgi:uroporphyrinogen decarboxylase